MDTVLITVPQIWDEYSDVQVDGVPITEWAAQQKKNLDTLLHEKGYRVKCMTSYIHKEVVMMHYALEREDQVVVQGDWDVRTEEPL